MDELLISKCSEVVKILIINFLGNLKLSHLHGLTDKQSI